MPPVSVELPDNVTQVSPEVAGVRLVMVEGLLTTMGDKKAPRSAVRRATAAGLALIEGRDTVNYNEQDNQFARVRQSLRALRDIYEAAIRDTGVSRPAPPAPRTRGGGAPKRPGAKKKPATRDPSRSGKYDESKHRRDREGEFAAKSQAEKDQTRREYDEKTKRAQGRLSRLGFNPGAQDGVAGPKTAAAIRKYQRSHGLSVTGKLDDATSGALDHAFKKPEDDSKKGSSRSGSRASGRASSGRSRSTGSSSRRGGATGTGINDVDLKQGDGMRKEKGDGNVKTLQAILDELGYDLGKPGKDGKLGPLTAKAIKKFQRENGLEPDGVVGPKTRKALAKAAKREVKREKQGIIEARDIRSEQDLREALAAFPHLADRARSRRTIISRARDLGCVGLLPEAWGVEELGPRGGVDLREAAITAAAQKYDERLHPRNRRGQFIDKPGVPKLPRGKASPATTPTRSPRRADDSSGSGPVARAWESQRELQSAQHNLALARANALDDLPYWDRQKLSNEELEARYQQDARVREFQAKVAELAPKVEAAQRAAGGRAYRVPIDNIPQLQKKIEKLNKRAVKVKVKPVKLEVTSETFELREKRNGVEFTVPYRFVTIDGETPKYEGWRFIASLDHRGGQGAEGTIIRRVPSMGEDGDGEAQQIDLDSYRFAENRCDQCGFVRNRNNTYIVHSKKDGIKQVGSECIKDFLGGADPKQVGFMAEYMADLDSDLEAHDEDGIGFGGADGGAAIRPRTEDYLAHVALAIRTRGYQARWRNQERQYDNTADAALDNLWAMAKGLKNRDGTPAYDVPTEEDIETAKAALEWVRSEIVPKESKSEFEHNLSVYAASDYLGEKGEGFMAYVPVAHTKAMEREVQYRQREKKNKEAQETSKHVGTVGKRMDFAELEVLRQGVYEGRYGTTYPTTFVDPEGNHIMWWANRPWKPGDRVSFSAGIKEHTVDRVTKAKTTVIQRPTKITQLERLAEGAGPMSQEDAELMLREAESKTDADGKSKPWQTKADRAKDSKDGEKGAGMKRCPSCGMKNAKGKTRCFKCKATLAKDGDAKLTKAEDKKKVQEASDGVTNWKAVTPENRKKVDGLVKHYMKQAHPFTACVRDNTKRFGKERAEKVCAVVKDMGMKTTKWRKGGGKDISEADFAEVLFDYVMAPVLQEAGVSVDELAAWVDLAEEAKLIESVDAPDPRELAVERILEADEATAVREAAETGTERSRAAAREQVAWDRVSELDMHVIEEAWGLGLLKGEAFNSRVMRSRTGQFIPAAGGSGGPDTLPKMPRAVTRAGRRVGRTVKTEALHRQADKRMESRARLTPDVLADAIFGPASPGKPDSLPLGRMSQRSSDEFLGKVPRGTQVQRVGGRNRPVAKSSTGTPDTFKGSAPDHFPAHRRPGKNDETAHQRRIHDWVESTPWMNPTAKTEKAAPTRKANRDGMRDRRATGARSPATAPAEPRSELGRSYAAGRARQAEVDEIQRKSAAFRDSQLGRSSAQMPSEPTMGEQEYRDALAGALSRATRDAARSNPGDEVARRRAVDQVRAEFGASRGARSPEDAEDVRAQATAVPVRQIHRSRYEAGDTRTKLSILANENEHDRTRYLVGNRSTTNAEAARERIRRRDAERARLRAIPEEPQSTPSYADLETVAREYDGQRVRIVYANGGTKSGVISSKDYGHTVDVMLDNYGGFFYPGQVVAIEVMDKGRYRRVTPGKA